jgi:multiple sugar transport system substrate-binding protein
VTTETYSRRSFLAGVVACGTLSASITYLLPGGRSPRPDQNQIPLRLASGADSTGALDLLLKIWRQANPNVPVDLDPIPSGTVDQRAEMRRVTESGQVDILNLDVIYFAEFARDNLIQKMKLPSYGKGHGGFLKKALSLGQVAGEPDRYWAVPYTTDVGMLYTRLPVARSGPDSLYDAVATAPPGSPQFVGQLYPTEATREAFVVNVLEHVLAADKRLRSPGEAPILDQTGKPLFALERWQRALKPLSDAVAQNKIVRVRTEADGGLTLADNEENTRAIFMRGHLRYMRNWPVHYRKLLQDRDVDATASRISVGGLPVGILGGSGLALAANTAHAEEALRFIQFLTDVPAQRILAEYGAAPTSQAMYPESPDSELRVQLPHLSAIRDAVDVSVPRPVIPEYQTFSNLIYDHVKGLLDGTELSQKFVDDMKNLF